MGGLGGLGRCARTPRSFLRDLEALYDRHGDADDTMPSLYGHFGHGCVHTRIPFDLYTERGVADYREFLQQAADLVTRYGGSLSGEHGDGQTRRELLPRMFGERIVEAFARLKAIFEPENRMNPGEVIEPYPLDANLRPGGGWLAREVGRAHHAARAGVLAAPADAHAAVGGLSERAAVVRIGEVETRSPATSRSLLRTGSVPRSSAR